MDQRAGTVRAFAAAPTNNPDGTTGINLHFYIIPGIDATQYTAAQLDLDPDTWAEMDFFKTNYSTPGRAGYFHWCLFADKYGTTDSSGRAYQPGELNEVAGFTPTGSTTEADLQHYGAYIFWGSHSWDSGWIDNGTDGASANLDFNHNGSIQSGTLPFQSVNNDDDTADLHQSSQNDWVHLIFNGGEIGGGFHALSACTVECMTPNDP
jgi:hypothetical protein